MLAEAQIPVTLGSGCACRLLSQHGFETTCRVPKDNSAKYYQLATANTLEELHGREE